MSRRAEILAECVDALLSGRDPYVTLELHQTEVAEARRLVETAKRVRSSVASFRDSVQLPSGEPLRLPEPRRAADVGGTVCGALMMAFTLLVLLAFNSGLPTTIEVSVMMGWLIWWLAILEKAPIGRGMGVQPLEGLAD